MAAPLEHPVPAGTSVYHVNQEWARDLPGGTAVVVEAHGPGPDGTWVYEVLACMEFALRPSDTNPQLRPARWPGAALRLAAPAPEGAPRLSQAEARAGLEKVLAAAARQTPEERRLASEAARFAALSWKLDLDRHPPQEGEWPGEAGTAGHSGPGADRHTWDRTLATWPSGPDGETDRLVGCACGATAVRSHEEDEEGGRKE